MTAIFQTAFSIPFSCMTISINISQKPVPKGQINDSPALVQIMALRRPDDKPLSELIMFSLLKHSMRHSTSVS